MRKHYSLRFGFGLLALLFAVCVIRVNAQTTPQSPVPLPTPFSPIVDNANVIDPETEARLVSIFYNLKDRGKIEFAVLTVDTTGDRDIFDFSLAVARGWGIGPTEGDKASFLLVVAVQDRKYFTQVSRHLEGDLPDGLVGQIQRQRLVPAFRQGNYSKGIFDTIQAYVATLAANRGFSVEGIDQRYAARNGGKTQNPEQSDGKSLSGICVGILIVGVFILLLFSASRRGGRGGRGGSGCLQALFWSALFSNFDSGNRRRGSDSYWGGGGFGGGGFGGGGGGFGGGFGGGGDFGGGGAGGSW